MPAAVSPIALPAVQLVWLGPDLPTPSVRVVTQLQIKFAFNTCTMKRRFKQHAAQVAPNRNVAAATASWCWVRPSVSQQTKLTYFKVMSRKFNCVAKQVFFLVCGSINVYELQVHQSRGPPLTPAINSSHLVSLTYLSMLLFRRSLPSMVTALGVCVGACFVAKRVFSKGLQRQNGEIGAYF